MEPDREADSGGDCRRVQAELRNLDETLELSSRAVTFRQRLYAVDLCELPGGCCADALLTFSSIVQGQARCQGGRDGSFPWSNDFSTLIEPAIGLHRNSSL